MPLPYAEIAVALAVPGTFTYEVPEALADRIQVGRRVLVSFGQSQVTGYVLQLLAQSDQDEVKPILEVLDEGPLFPPPMVALFRWAAQYYFYPLGKVIKEALPGGLNVRGIDFFSLTEKGRSDLGRFELSSLDRSLLEALGRRGSGADLAVLANELKDKIPTAVLRRLERGGWIARERRLRPGLVGPKKVLYVKKGPVDLRPEGVSKARGKILALVERDGEVALSTLRAEVSSAGRIVKALAREGGLQLVERRVCRDPFGEAIEAESALPVPTAAQRQIIEKVIETLGQGFRTYLLHGVTGSGKTEIYMRAAAAAVDRGYQALVLVPEIALISQTERRFRARFGDCVAVLHSGLTPGERFDQWMRILRREAAIAVGARSAIFAPFDRLGIIIVDEEHDDSYKQDANLRYHARDLAAVRAKLEGAVALFGSATPSAQSYHHGRTKKYESLRLTKRIEDRPLPEVTIVDLRLTEGPRRSKPFVTEELKKAMEETLGRGDQVLLFLNRRGFASYPTCGSCGKPVRCTSCDITLTLHQEANAYRCHYCGFTRAANTGCAACGSAVIKPLGPGTEKLEETVKHLFPEAAVSRMDRDTMGRKGALLSLLKRLREGSVDILIGTQMVAKGHDYPNITLVGIICADLSLNFPDFRAGERTFQLLAQVAGRAGRGERPGRVILQTFNPEHFCILTARDQDYQAFFEQEIACRRTLNYPPFSRLVQILFRGKDKEDTTQQALRVGKICRGLISANPSYARAVECLGPVPAPLSRVKGQFRWHLLLKGRAAGALHAVTHDILAQAGKEVRQQGVAMIVDVDPVDML